MKVFKTVRALIGAVAISLVSAFHTFAIEGIQLSVQSSNVLLSWPSATNETYIVQSLKALASTNTWTTLTDLFPAALNTNLTVFVASNSVNPTIWITNSGGGGTNSGGMAPPGGGGTNGSVSGYATGFYRVVRDGVHIFGMTNGAVLSGTIQQPIEFAVDATDEIVGLSFYDTNDNPVIGAHATPGPGGGWILNWNTTQSANGNYAIEAELDFANANPVVSVPVTVTVSNLFSFPNYLTQLFGSQMWIYAQTVPNATVEIDMYDENTNYLGSFYPVDSDGNGVISFIWDLTDGNGHTYNDTNFMGVWTVVSSPGISQSANTKTVNSGSPNFPLPTTKLTPGRQIKPAGGTPGGGGLRPSAVVWINEAKWTPNDNWVVSVADMGSPVPYFFVYGGRTSPQEDGGVIGTLQNLHKTIAPGISYNSNFDPIQIVSDATTRGYLLAFLAAQNPRFENFFWFGHGSGYSIQANETNTTMTELQIAQALGNGIFVSSGVNIYGYSQHPYRFVWCDGCNTTEGELCEAFAIPAQDLRTNNFIAGGVMSRAYLGNKNVVYIDTNQSDGIWQARSQVYSTFFANFLEDSGYSLAALVYFGQRLQGPFSQNTSYFMDSSLTSLGATDMLYVKPW